MTVARRPIRSISLTIVLASVSVCLAIALLVGWTLLIVGMREQFDGRTGLLVAGIIGISLIMIVLIVLCVFVVREILEVRRQTTFIDSVTHELKSPLASLRLCLETLARSGLEATQVENLRRMMLEDVDRLSIFVDDVLIASRVAVHPFHRKASIALQDISVRELAEHCRQLILRRYRLPDDSIAITVPADLQLTTDRTALETILKNLLDNAVKYSDEIFVSVRAEAQPNAISLHIVDRGIGIPPEHLKRVFQRFYRVPTEDVRRRHGTGLGLFVVSALARHLGGKIEARSDGHGRGCEVIVTLPRDGQRWAA